jgi:hypothetical protein
MEDTGRKGGGGRQKQKIYKMLKSKQGTERDLYKLSASTEFLHTFREKARNKFLQLASALHFTSSLPINKVDLLTAISRCRQSGNKFTAPDRSLAIAPRLFRSDRFT